MRFTREADDMKEKKLPANMLAILEALKAHVNWPEDKDPATGRAIVSEREREQLRELRMLRNLSPPTETKH